MKGRLFDRHLDLLVGLLLSLAVLAAFLQVFGHDFTNWDDDKYVTQNPHVLTGLTSENLSWAFTSGYASNWHPLTWISHMLDSTLFGKSPAGPHAVNLVLHIASTVLLFVVLRRATGFVWRSAFVAALFGIHPLHVESVAWIAERKDVLSTLFWMLTMLAYVRYTERPEIGRYVPVFVLFALGLMAKPMLVTLPFVLLLLDYWPLQRISTKKGWTFRRLFAEKLPLIAISVVSCVVTYIVQQQGGSMDETQFLSVGMRVSNAFVAYMSYAIKMLWPARLWTPYLHHAAFLPTWQVAASVMGFLGLTALALVLGRKRPCLSVGWLWFAGTLIPVIGLVQVGYQSMADRYTYVPLIGLFVAIAYGSVGVWEYGGKTPDRPTHPHSHTPILACIILAALMPITWRQVGYWKNSGTLFEHALAMDTENEVAHNNLGVYLQDHDGKLDEAAEHYAEAMRINPRYAYAYLNMGNVYSARREFDKSIDTYEQALEYDPNCIEAHGNMANSYAEMGRFEDAVEHFDVFLERMPDKANALYNRGKSLAALGRFDEAIEDYRRVIELDPNYAEVHYNLGHALRQLGDTDGAMAEYRQAIRIDPKNSEAHNNLANILLSQQQYDEAIAEYHKAIEAKPTNAEAQNNLAGAYYYKGDYEAACKQVEELRKRGIEVNPNLIAALSQAISGL